MGRRKKYNTEEERKAARKAYKAEYYQNNKEKIAEYYQNNKEKIAEYYQNNKDEVLAKQAEYRANHKEEKAAYDVEYRAKNKEKIAEYRAKHKDEIVAKQADYYQKNKEKKAEYMAEYRSTPFGRASHLVDAYRLKDKKYNRGECTIDAQWIVDNIFTQSCHYCGETDWHKLGCDRIDNSLPHTPENVVCSCLDCNIKKHTTPYEEFMRMIGKVA